MSCAADVINVDHRITAGRLDLSSKLFKFSGSKPASPGASCPLLNLAGAPGTIMIRQDFCTAKMIII